MNFLKFIQMNQFWIVARAYTTINLKCCDGRNKKTIKEVYNWFDKMPPTPWNCHTFIERVNNDHILNNMTDSFNQ